MIDLLKAQVIVAVEDLPSAAPAAPALADGAASDEGAQLKAVPLELAEKLCARCLGSMELWLKK